MHSVGGGARGADRVPARVRLRSNLPPMDRPLIVEDGRILAYRIFEVGDELDLDAAERLLTQRRGRQRPTLAREKGQGLLFATPPLDIELNHCVLELPAPFTQCRALL